MIFNKITNMRPPFKYFTKRKKSHIGEVREEYFWCWLDDDELMTSSWSHSSEIEVN